jgi:hypothetical protein
MQPAPGIDPKQCPVCGAQNSCAVAASSKEFCWCMTVQISEQALARVPAAARDVACLCPRCASLGARPGDAEPKLP